MVEVQPFCSFFCFCFFIVLAMLRCVARRYQGSGLTLLESCRGCCWSRYYAKPEIVEENSASLMTFLDASSMYDKFENILRISTNKNNIGNIIFNIFICFGFYTYIFSYQFKKLLHLTMMYFSIKQ